MKLKLEIEHEERRLARKEAQRACDAEKALQDAQLLQARELRLAELKEARELRELELKTEREKHDLELKAEQEKALLEAEKDPAAREHELKMASLGKHLPSDKARWVLLLQSVLVGKAQEIYGSLSVEHSSNYEQVKEAILKAYELIPEAYRQKFRNY